MKTILIAVCLVASCLVLGAPKPAEDYLLLNQGWTAKDAEKAFHWNLGTEMMPARWFMALEKADSSQKFAQGLERFGFVVRANGIPVGVTFDENEITAPLYKEKQWVGVNCAACHSSALEVKGKTLLIQGNQSQIRLQEFEESIVKSVDATLSDSAKMARFASSLSERDVPDLSLRLKFFRDEFSEAHERDHRYFDAQNSEVRWGPGRIDGLGGATNSLACSLTPRMSDFSFLEKIFANPKNCGPSHAPTSIPHLWGMTNQDLVQWNGQVHASLGRNVGALMAGYGKNWVEATTIGIPKVMTTVKISEVFEVEDLYKKLKAPVWQDVVKEKLGEELDQLKVASGERLFIQNCQSCHSVQPKLTEPNKFGNRYWDYPMIPVSEVGTDRSYTEDEKNHQTYVNPILAPLYLAIFGFSNFELNGKIPAFAARGILPGAAIANFFRENKISAEDRDRMNNCREDKRPEHLDGIKAKSLEGILFTAPYLHNGSVPTIYDLLEKPSNRPAKFYLGCRQYNMSKFGYDCEPQDPNVFVFDTSRQGNGNQGHDYGTSLSATEKSDLVEFIKSLQPPAYTPENMTCN